MIAKSVRMVPVGACLLACVSLAAAGDAPVAPPPGPLDLIRATAAAMRGAEPDTAKVEASILWSRYGLPLGSRELSGDLGAFVKALATGDEDPKGKVVEDGGTAPHRFARCEVEAGGGAYVVTLVEEDGWKIARVVAPEAASAAPKKGTEKGVGAATPPATPVTDVKAIARADQATEAVLAAIDGHDTKAFLALAAPVGVGEERAQMGEAFGEAIVARLHEKYGQRPHRLGAVTALERDGRRHLRVQVLFGDREDLADVSFYVDERAALLVESVTGGDVKDFVGRDR